MLEKKSSCQVCHNRINNILYLVKERILGTKKEFPYLLCSKCLSLSICEIPNNMQEYYQNYHSIQSAKVKKNFLKKFIKTYILANNNFLAKKLYRLLNSYDDLSISSLFPYKFKKSIKILDIGCGTGALVEELASLGFQHCIGIDPFLEKNQIFENGAKIFKKSLFDLQETYDLVMLHHSFEHMPEIHKVVKQLDKLVAKNGICILRFPSIESYSFRKFQQNWEGIHAPFHFVLPSQKGMHHLFEPTNLNIIEIRGEQLTELFLRSINYSLDICDVEDESIKRFLQKKTLKEGLPPLFTKKEIAFWKEKKKVLYGHFCDYIAYFLKKS